LELKVAATITATVSVLTMFYYFTICAVVVIGTSNIVDAVRFGDINAQHYVDQASHIQKDISVNADVEASREGALRTKEFLLPSERPRREIGEVIEFELFDGEVVFGKVERIFDRGVKGVTWSGSLEYEDSTADMSPFENRFTLSCYKKACSGSLTVESTNSRYKLSPAIGRVLSSNGEGVYRISQMGERPKVIGIDPEDAMEKDKLDGYESMETLIRKAKSTRLSSLASEQTMTDTDLIVDIGVMYTQQALDQKGISAAAMIAHVHHINDEGNVINADSQVLIRFRIVFIMPIADLNYVEPADTADGFSELLYQLRRTSDGKMDEAHDYRDQYGADIVVLFNRADAYGGSAYVLRSPNQQYAFGNYAIRWTDMDTWCHELGHNQGCHHDRFSKNPAEYPASYTGYGHCWENSAYSSCVCYKSILVYDCNTDEKHCTSCSERYYYSNKNVMNAGNPTGTDLASCALQINLIRYGTIAYREAVHNSGLVFSVVPSDVQLSECRTISIIGWKLAHGDTITKVTLAGVEAKIRFSNENRVNVESPRVNAPTTEAGDVVVTTSSGRVTTAHGIFSFNADTSATGSTCTASLKSLPTSTDPVFTMTPSWSFSGVNSGLRFDALARSPSTKLTISMFITTTTKNRYLASLGKSPISTDAYFVFMINTNGNLQFQDKNDAQGGIGFNGLSSSTVTSGSRTHVAFVRDGTSGTFYINGVADRQITASRSVSYANEDLAIGYDYGRTHGSFFNGNIDTVRIFNHALNAAQMSSLYTNDDPGVSESPSVMPSRKPTSSIPTFVPSQPSVTPTETPSSPTAEPTISPTSRPTYIEPFFLSTGPHIFSGDDKIHYPALSVSVQSFMTIAMSITTTSTSPYVVLMSVGASSSFYQFYFHFALKDGWLNFWDYGNPTRTFGFDQNTGYGVGAKVNTGIKTHIAFVKRYRTGKFYVNGALIETVTADYNFRYRTEDHVLGYDIRNNMRYFNGEMEDVRVYDKSLTDADMLVIAATMSPTISPTMVPSIPTTLPTLAPSHPPVTVPDHLFKMSGPAIFNGDDTCGHFQKLSQSVDTELSISMFITTSHDHSYLTTLGRTADNKDGQFLFYIHYDGHLTFYDYDIGNGYGFEYRTGFSEVRVDTGVRTHVGFVRNGMLGTFYVNGQPSGSFNAIKSITYRNEDLAIGYDPRYDAKYFDGKMEHVKIFNTALNAAHMAYMYESEI